jgi:hypothetical protein
MKEAGEMRVTASDASYNIRYSCGQGPVDAHDDRSRRIPDSRELVDPAA